ncbi:MAG: methylmalonyl-CoA mutase, partial [Alphaproteobacteria bacterium]|nr:methylmalonyl-CoA mutase [Alphaproteobacteria bacterium]
LNAGATGLALVIAGTSAARSYGVSIESLPRVLEGVALHAIALRIEGEAAAAQALAAHVGRQPLDPARLDISFGLSDPTLADALSRQGFAGPFLEADGRAWHERGATAAEELGAVLATAVSWLAPLPATAIGVTVAANQDMFLTLAKFRAMRLLWARALETLGMAQAVLRLHGETGFRMMANRDPHTNILRTTAAVFGAGLGGADSITVLPFSIAQGLPDRFARRIARNVQNVLLAESNLWRVADPAAGAGYVEHLTEALCEKAWRHFQNAMAGIWPMPNPGRPEGLPVIGTTAYPLETEHPPAIEARP